MRLRPLRVCLISVSTHRVLTTLPNRLQVIFERAEIEGSPRIGSSTWQSLARGRPSVETDYLNGEIVLLGVQCTASLRPTTALCRSWLTGRLTRVILLEAYALMTLCKLYKIQREDHKS